MYIDTAYRLAQGVQHFIDKKVKYIAQYAYLTDQILSAGSRLSLVVILAEGCFEIHCLD